jgi:hypothetical protein
MWLEQSLTRFASITRNMPISDAPVDALRSAEDAKKSRSKWTQKKVAVNENKNTIDKIPYEIFSFFFLQQDPQSTGFGGVLLCACI